ncbi:MAG: hypothetical protein ACKO5E_01300 [bacterium]
MISSRRYFSKLLQLQMIYPARFIGRSFFFLITQCGGQAFNWFPMWGKNCFARSLKTLCIAATDPLVW